MVHHFVLIFGACQQYLYGTIRDVFFILFLCLQSFLFRWMVRSAYNIGDSDRCFDDCVLSILCPCCVVNQLYHTTVANKNPTLDGGYYSNNIPMSTIEQPNDSCCNACSRGLCALFCFPCTVGTMMQDSLGMPYCMGCCCVGFFPARNFIRYQFRLKSSSGKSDTSEECFWPCLIYGLGSIVATVLPCVWGALCVGLIGLNVQLQKEVESRVTPTGHKGYLVGYHPSIGAYSPPESLSPIIASSSQPQVYRNDLYIFFVSQPLHMCFTRPVKPCFLYIFVDIKMFRQYFSAVFDTCVTLQIAVAVEAPIVVIAEAIPVQQAPLKTAYVA